MSMLQQLQQQQASAQALMVAEQEMDAMADVFNRLVDCCFKKCIPSKYSEGDLNKGESVCVDRCTQKFMESHQLIGRKLQQLGEQAMAAQQIAAAQQPQ